MGGAIQRGGGARVMVVHTGEWSGRREDQRLMVGAAHYVGDLAAPDCVEVAFVRSYLPHARITSVDTGAALESPGVIGAYAASDLPDLPLVPPSAGNERPTEGRDRPALASAVVRFTGEAVAVVAATDRYNAEDGADKVWVDLESLDVVTNPVEAIEDRGPRLFPEASNLALDIHKGRDVGVELESAPVVIEREYWNRRLAHSPMEARAVLAIPEEGGMTVWCSHQGPHRLKDALEAAFSDRVLGGFRVRTPEVGGAFGQKSHTYPEYVVVVELALLLGRPVRWIEDRRESLMASAHGRDQYQRIRLAADEEGTLMAAEIEVVGDLGAYPHTGSYVPLFTGTVVSGPYRIPAMSVRIRSAVTNKAPTCPYRGAGRPEAAFLLERTIDDLAVKLDMDPAKLRLRNFIDSSSFPYRTPTGSNYDSGDYAETLRQALTLIDYDSLRREQHERRASGGRPLGIGICTFVERSGGTDPSPEYGAVEVGWDGEIIARSGAASTGQGHETAFPQVVASVLQVDPGRVKLVQKDTADVPQGIGSFASRSMQVGGSALHQAASEVLEEAMHKASDLRGVDVNDLSYESGTISDRNGGEEITLHQIAEKAGPLAREVMFSSPQAFPSGSYVAVVEVDPDTGQVEILGLVAVDDSGTIINPELVHGQTRGSVAQGIGQALYEEFVYDETGQPLTTTFMDYLLPTASEVPELVMGAIETPNPNSPIGAKGAGEAGTIGVPPAVMNAIVDALRPLGVTEVPMPATPGNVRGAIEAVLEEPGAV